jgi:hypothetical protein
MNATVHALCDACGGSGKVDVDRFDGRGEHYTTSEPCETCDSTGDVVVEDEDIGPILDAIDADAEVEWEAPL